LRWLLFGTSLVAGCSTRFDAVPRLFEAGAASNQTHDVRLTGALVDRSRRPCECPGIAAILVAIQNASDRLLSVRYENIILRWAAGQPLRPLPAFDLEDTQAIGLPVSYTYPWSGFRLAAPLSRYYRGFWSGAAEVPRDSSSYQTRHAALVAMTAPGAITDLVQAALPEGDLEPDGHIAGLLYFERHGDTSHATLSATLTNPDTGARGVVLDISIDTGNAGSASPP
jgi:hypothetical protein